MENQINPVTPPVATNVSAVPVKYAGFWIRFVAVMVDSLVLIIPVIILQFITGVVFTSIGVASNVVSIFSSLVYLIATWLYFCLMTYYKGATLGKMLVGITVKSDSLEKLSFGKILLRETIGKIISQLIFCIGYIIVGFTQKKQGLHDMLVKSVVVYKDPTNPKKAGLIIGIIIACIIPALVIMSILASVVLVSLNSARQKSQSAGERSVVQELRAVAELYYSQHNNSYSVAHDCSSGLFADQTAKSILAQIKDQSVLSCFAENQTYAVSVRLTRDRQNNYCIDSTAFSGDGIAVDNGSKAICKVI